MDEILTKIATYVSKWKNPNENALNHARYCLLDAMGCAILALKYPECTQLLGPIVPGTIVPEGARIPGTKYVLDPVQGAFNFGAMVRWLDFNDTFLAAEWAHPSDNLGGILPLMDYLSQKKKKEGKEPWLIRDLLLALIQVYEVQGGLSLHNSFNRVGYDHVLLVKVAMCGVATRLLGGNLNQIEDALSQAFIDVGSLRTYRHAPNTGPRKSWAAGDASSRAIFLAYITMRGEKGYQTPLSAPKWGLQDVLFGGKKITLEHELGSYIIENILYKVSFPAEFHAQTAVEAALQLHPALKNKMDQIDHIDIHTHEAALRIIDKKGPLRNFADRDHSMQYMVATALIHGNLTSNHYSDEAAKDPRIDALREKIHIYEEKQFSKDYLDPEIRSIASTLTVILKDGTHIGPLSVEFPIGHKRRRDEGIPLLFEKARKNLLSKFNDEHVEKIIHLFQNPQKLDSMPVNAFTDLFL